MMSAIQVVNPGGPCKCRPPVVIRRYGHGGKKVVIKRRKGICPAQS